MDFAQWLQGETIARLLPDVQLKKQAIQESGRAIDAAAIPTTIIQRRKIVVGETKEFRYNSSPVKARRSHGVSAIDHNDTSRTSLQQYQMEGTKEMQC